MATIPMGEFGQARAVPRPARDNVDLSPLNQSGRGAAALGAAGMDVGQRMAHVSEQEQQRRAAEAEQLARAKAANATLDDQIEVQSKLQEVRSRISDGSLPYTQASEEFETWYSQRTPREIPDLDPSTAEHYQGGLKRNRFAAQTELDGVVQGARRADGINQVAGLRDRLGKFASDPNADIDKLIAQGAAIRPLADGFGVGATFEKDHQTWADRVASENAKARLVASRDDLGGLAQLEQDLTAEGGRYVGKLDADKTNSLLSQIQTRRAQLEEKTRIEADRSEAIAGRALTAFEAQISSGMPAPMETMTGWSEAIARGTPEQRKQWSELVKGEAEIRSVLQQPPAAQRAHLQAMRAKAQREGATLADQANLKRLESAVATGEKQLRESPLEFYGSRTGEAVAPIDLEAIASGDVGAIQQQIGQRMAILATMEKQYGPGTGRAPLLPQEAAALSQAVERLPPEQLTAFYGNVRRAFGDDRAYLAAMGQIAKDSPVRAVGGALSLTNPKGAALVVKGAKILAGGDGKAPVPIPSDKDFRDELARVVGDAFADRPEAFGMALQVVRAGYAGAASTDGKSSEELDPDRLENVVRFALGTPLRWQGRTVIAPPGFDDDEFEDAIEAAYRAASKPKDAGDLDRYQLRQFGSGTYRLVRGREFLMGPNGPVTLRVGR